MIGKAHLRNERPCPLLMTHLLTWVVEHWYAGPAAVVANGNL
jgi:hypothetical protein